MDVNAPASATISLITKAIRLIAACVPRVR
jgi:hypothetical protein